MTVKELIERLSKLDEELDVMDDCSCVITKAEYDEDEDAIVLTSE
jgi:hypothetical protein